MTYTPQNWADYPSGGTPISAARLNHMEQGILDASTAAGAAANGTTALSIATAAQAAAAAAQSTANAAKAATDLLGRIISTSTAFTAASGWSVNRQAFTKIGRLATSDVSVNRTGSTITVGASGNITNTLIGTVTNEFLPTLTFQPLVVGPGGAIGSFFITNNQIFLAAYAPNTNITAGSEVTFGGPWVTAS